jgi:hypothetical protein
MSRSILLSLVAAFLSACAPSTLPQQGDLAATDAGDAIDLGASQATAERAAPTPTAAVQPQPQVIYVPQPVYVYDLQPIYGQSQAQATWGAASYQSGCGIVGDCGRSVVGRDVDVNLHRNNCTSHLFGNIIQTSCY